MTKRKRDIFTVIESINNWFEASEHYTRPAEDHEGASSRLGPISDPTTIVTTNDWAAKCLDSGNDAEPWAEVSHVASNCPSDNNEVRVQSEVVGRLATRPKADSQLAVGIGGGTESRNRREAIRNEGSPVDGHGPVGVNEDTNLTLVPCTEVAGEGGLTLTAFWRVLEDAGYDVW